MTWRSVCPVDAIADGTPLGVVVDGVDVCLVRLDDRVFALHDACTHEAVPLSDGDVFEGAIECWLHGSRFDLTTGVALNPPAIRPVTVYPVRTQAGYVHIDL